MPFIASSTITCGRVSRILRACVSTRPPGYPEWRRYSFWSSFLPVSRTFAALTTTTWSPVSRNGVYVGLFLPMRTRAAWAAMRPRTLPSASITCQVRTTSFLDGTWVFIRTDLLRSGLTNHPVYRIEGRGCQISMTCSPLLSRSKLRRGEQIHRRQTYYTPFLALLLKPAPHR